MRLNVSSMIFRFKFLMSLLLIKWRNASKKIRAIIIAIPILLISVPLIAFVIISQILELYTNYVESNKLRVIATNIEYGQEEIPLEQPIILNFSKPLDDVTLVQINSELKANFEESVKINVTEDKQSIEITPESGWKSDKSYALSLSRTATLAESFALAFDTVKIPQILVTSIKDSISKDTDLMIAFNQNLFSDSSILPTILVKKETSDTTVSGIVELLSPNVIRFKPDKLLEAGSKYNLTLDNQSITNSAGLTMQEDYSTSFNVTEPKADNLPQPDYYYSGNFIAEMSGLVRAGTSDPVIVVLNPNVTKENFAQNYYLSDKSSKLESDLTWQVHTAKSLIKDYKMYISFEDSNQQLNVAVISPRQLWKTPAENRDYKIVVSKNLVDKNGSRTDSDIYSSIYPIDRLKATGNNLTEKDKSLKQEELYIHFNNPLLENQTLTDFVKLYYANDTENAITAEVKVEYQSITVKHKWENGRNYKLVVLPGLLDIYESVMNDNYDFMFKYNSGEDTSNKAYVNIFGENMAYADNTGQHRILIEASQVAGVTTEILRITPEQFIDFHGMGSYYYDESWLSKYFDTTSSETKKFEKTISYKPGQVERFEYKLENFNDGIYLIRSQSNDGKHRDARILILSTYTAMFKKSTSGEILTWVNNTKTGEGYANKTIKLAYKTEGEAMKTIETNTNSDGIATFDIESNNWYTKYLYSKDGDVMVFDDYRLQQGLSTYDYLDYEGYYSDPADDLGFLYTDKPVYRTGQEVLYKVYVRSRKDNRLQLEQKTYTLEVKNQKDDVIYTHNFEPNDFGTYNSVFKLDENLQSGEYRVILNGQNKIGDFRVEDYKPFNFKFSAKTDLGKYYSTNDKINLEIDTIYYFGNPVKNAAVNVNLYVRDIYYYEMAEDETFKKYNQYNFPALSMYEDYYNYSRYSSQKIASAKAITDENGRAVLSIPFSVPDNISNGFLKSLSIEIEVKDPLGESEFQTLYTKISPKNGVVIFKSDDYYVNNGENYFSKIVYLNEKFAAQPNSNITIEIFKEESRQIRRQGLNGVPYWDYFTERIPASKQTVNTGSDGIAEYTFTPDTPGSYSVVYKLASDAKVINTDNFYYFERSYYDYSYNNNAKIELKTNKTSYNLNDQLEITPVLPNRNYKGLMTFERDGILEYKIIDFRDTPVIKTTLAEKFQPNIYVSLYAFAPIDYGNKYLDYKMGLKNINISIQDKYLDIELSTDKAKYKPREKVTLNIKSKNQVETEYLIGVVDKAVLDVSKIKHNESLQDRLIKRFWAKWYHGIETFSNLSIYENKIVAETKWGSKGGDGLGGDGGGLRGLQEEDVRKNFKEVAFWLPSQIATDGNSQFTFDVPDNLTTWEIVVIGVTKDTKISAKTTSIIVSKDVNIVSALPYYLYTGDEIVIPYTVSFNEEFLKNNQQTAYKTQLNVENGDLECNNAWQGSCEQGNIKSSDLPVNYKFRPKSSGTSKFTFMIYKGDELLDAEELNINILASTQSKKVLKYSNTKSGETFKYTFPQGSQDLEKKVKIIISERILSSFDDFKAYFIDYSNKCSEQTASQILSLIAYTSDEKAAKLIENGILRLYALQNIDGGWGVWVNNQSIDYNSIHVLRALNAAKEAGFDVDQARIDKALAYFESRNEGMDESTYLEFWRLMADFGKFDINGLNNFYSQQLNSTQNYHRLYGNYADMVYIYHKYLKTNRSNDAYIKNVITQLKRKLYDSRIQTTDKYFWSEPKEFTYYYYDNDINSTATILYTLLEIDGDNKNLLGAVNYLKSKLDNSSYLGSHSTFYIFNALKKADEVFSKEGKISNPIATLNGKTYKSFKKENGNRVLEINLEKDVQDVDLKLESNQLAFYNVELSYQLPFENVKVEQKKLSIYSEYKNLDGTSIPSLDNSSSFEKDSLYKVDTYIFVPEDLQQSEIHIPIPAGFRAVNFNLANTSDVQSEQVTEINYNTIQNLEIRDKEVVFYTGENYYGNGWKKGVYKLNFMVRANYVGNFRTGGEYVNEMYLPGRYSFQEYRNYIVN